MPQLTANQKHNILTIYSSTDNTYSFESLAHQYNIKGGKNVIWRWYQKWDGTPQSLGRKKGSGRPTVLTSQQVNDYIRTPIRIIKIALLNLYIILNSIHLYYKKQARRYLSEPFKDVVKKNSV